MEIEIILTYIAVLEEKAVVVVVEVGRHLYE